MVQNKLGEPEMLKLSLTLRSGSLPRLVRL